MKCRILASCLLVAFAFSSISSADHPFSQTPAKNTQEQGDTESEGDSWEIYKRSASVALACMIAAVFIYRQIARAQPNAPVSLSSDAPMTTLCGNAPSKCCCSSKQGE